VTEARGTPARGARTVVARRFFQESSLGSLGKQAGRVELDRDYMTVPIADQLYSSDTDVVGELVVSGHSAWSEVRQAEEVVRADSFEACVRRHGSGCTMKAISIG
jgi:hypothetical protein